MKGFSNGFITRLALGGLVLLSLVAGAYFWLLPVYHDRPVQNKISEVFVSTDVCRAVVARAVKDANASSLSASLFGCDGGAASGVKISKHLKSIAMGDAGSITVTFDYRELSQLTPFTNTLTLIPLVDTSNPLRVGDVKKDIAGWRCGSAADGTTVPQAYLPSGCRG
jgi:type IV pilus assembly protein PilA